MHKRTVVALLSLAATLLPLPSLASETSDAQAPSAERRVVAYYFHGHARCKTCLTIERYSQEALESGFQTELADGRLEWLVVDIDEPENEHFVEDFQLVSKSLVLVEYTGEKVGEFKVLPKVWRLTGDKDAFLAYVQRETRAMLGAL
jgi:hypothetical protein